MTLQIKTLYPECTLTVNSDFIYLMKTKDNFYYVCFYHANKQERISEDEYIRIVSII